MRHVNSGKHINQDREILGLTPNTDVPPQALRTAYLEKIRQYPPESDAGMFEKVRDAYQRLSDPHLRVRMALNDFDLDKPLQDQLTESCSGGRPYVGSEVFLSTIERQL